MSDLVMLASKYNAKKHDVVGWLASHKIDGIRAYWDPEEEIESQYLHLVGLLTHCQAMH